MRIIPFFHKKGMTPHFILFFMRLVQTSIKLFDDVNLITYTSKNISIFVSIDSWLKPMQQLSSFSK